MLTFKNLFFHYSAGYWPDLDIGTKEFLAGNGFHILHPRSIFMENDENCAVWK